MEHQSIAKNLIYNRKLKGYTQEQLSEKTQVTVRTIQRIEKGEVNPHLQTVKLLATALGIEVEDLLILENPKEEVIQKKWLLLMHSVPILGFVIPLCNILIPLFLWIHKREDNKTYDNHGRAIINFHITSTILFILSFIALLVLPGAGFFMFITVIPYTVIVMIINVISAVNSQKCHYPLSFPVIRKNKGNIPKNLTIIIMLLGLFLTSCTKVKPQEYITRLDGTTITKDSLTQKIQQLCDKANVHGAAITIFNENKITYQKSFGYQNYPKKLFLNDSTNMYGASFSKAVFAVLVLKLIEENVIDLDTPLESYLPKKIYEYEPRTRWHDDFSSLKTDTLYHQITARMCLNHTTGFPNWRWYENDHKLRVKLKPGTRYNYSGEGFVYLQVVLEKILNRNLEDLAQEKIFIPIGMNRSSYQWKSDFENNVALGHSSSGKTYKKDIDNEPRGGSTLETTFEDYSKFLEAVLEKKIITQKSWNELFKPQIRIRSIKQFGPLSQKDTTLNDNIKLSYGLGWGLLDSPYGIGAFKEGHTEGFQHYSIIFPKVGTGIMIMTNSDNGEGIFKELLEISIGNSYTPWKWQNYIPYNNKKDN